VWWRKRGE